MPEPRAVANLLRALATVFGARGIRWYVFGAQAVMIWGRPRFSADVDVTAAVDPSEREAFMGAMRREGFRLLIDDHEFIERTRVLPFVHPNGVPLDVVLAGRPKDIDDVRGVLRERHSSLDLDYIRGVLDLLEQALGQSDLRRTFESELQRV